MKTIARIAYLLLISILVGWLSAGCGHSPNDPSPGNTCRIQQYVSRSSSFGFTTQNQIDYTYDQRGNLTKMTTTFEKRPLSGTVTSQTGSTNVDYLYDADGYLTTSTSTQKLTTLFAGKTTVEQTSVISSYTYVGGRLTNSRVRRVGAYGVNTTTVEAYQYDGSGDLQKKTSQSTYEYDPAVAKEIPKSPVGALRTWTYQKNQLTDYVENYENADYRPLTIQSGLITKLTLPGDQGDYVATYEYDSQQRVTKWGEYIGGVLSRSYTQTWSSAKPSSAALPTFKGWPVITQEFSQAGVTATNTSYSLNTSSGKTELEAEQTSAIQTNSQGFVTTNVITTKAASSTSASQNKIITETYQYLGCQ